MSEQWVGSADLSVRGDESKVCVNPVQELTQEIDRKMFGHLQARVRELETVLTDVLQQKVNKLKVLAPRGVFSPEDFSIINLMGDVESLTEQLANTTKRAEAAEAVLKDLRTIMEYADIDFAGWGIPGQEEAYGRLNEWLYPTRREAQP